MIDRPIRIWLWLCAAMVFAMALIGAVTRLTESGLSMAEWRPLMGALPPLSDAEWRRVFAVYQKTPQFREVNDWMGLADFKTIFFWEWFHRLWGRLIGLVFALPFLWFLARGRLRGARAWKLAGILALGGLQGAVGWWMVASGLVDNPRVSHLRLASHLLLAVVIFLLLLRASLPPAPAGGPRRHGLFALALGLATLAWGAFTAGLDAGLAASDFPTMNGSWIPPQLTWAGPVWRNIVEDPVSVQFTHRWLGISLCLVCLALAARLGPAGRPGLGMGLAAMAIIQPALGVGVVTLGVPVPLAALHQAGALTLLALLALAQGGAPGPANMKENCNKAEESVI